MQVSSIDVESIVCIPIVSIDVVAAKASSQNMRRANDTTVYVPTA